MPITPIDAKLGVSNSLFEVLPGLSGEKVGRFMSAYSEPRRTYHNLNHIWGMLESGEGHFKALCLSDEWRALRIKTLYHDVVNEVGDASKDNERASADWMADDLFELNELKWPESCAWAGIYATKTHSLEGVPPQYQKTTAMLIDLDLEGLGLSKEGFAVNTEAIWHEYEPIASRKQSDEGRAKWAQSFLARPYIFQTELFRDKYETQARRNLARLQG